MLIRLTYASCFAPDRSREDFDDMVAFCRHTYPVLDIGGVISFNGTNIVEVLEGDGDVVSEVFRRILMDNRHQGVVELGRSVIEARQLFSWGLVRWPVIEVAIMSLAI